MRHVVLIAVLAVLVAGCGATGSTAPAPASNPVQTALPTSTATPVVTPSAAPTPAPSPKIVAGWPKVSRGGVTMTGRTVDATLPSGAAGDPVIRVKVTGLDAGEVVTLSGTGRYERAVFCGPVPSGCQGISPTVESYEPVCLPEHSPGGYADAYFGLREALEDLFDRAVDLVALSAIRNPYMKADIERTRTLLYAA